MSVQSAQVFFEYFQKHPNVSSEFSRVFRTSCEIFSPKPGIKKKDYIQRIRRCAVIPFNQCDPGGARTLDPLIKSQLLYQLSYGVMHRTGISLPSLRMQRYNLSANRPNIFSKNFSQRIFSLERQSAVGKSPALQTICIIRHMSLKYFLQSLQ